MAARGKECEALSGRVLVMGGVRGFLTQIPVKLYHRVVTQRRPRTLQGFAMDATNFDYCYTEQAQINENGIIRVG